MIPTHRPHFSAAEERAVTDVLRSGWLGMGPRVQQFEQRIAELLDVPHVIAVNSGTAALHLALEVLNLQSGDEVILPSMTFVATPQAVIAAGGIPVFCDIDEQTANIDIDDAMSRVTPRTRAIVPVHYGGVSCDMNELLDRAGRLNLVVIEDAAQAFASRYGGENLGTLGDIGCFSFDPIKNISCGGGGALVTRSDQFADVLKKKRNLGIDRDSWTRINSDQDWYYNVTTSGLRYHMGDMNAAIGLVQLDRLESFRARKIEIVQNYDRVFADIEELALPDRNLPEVFPFSYYMRVLDGRRNQLASVLAQDGIGTTVRFVPNHLQPFFERTPKSSLPVTEAVYDEIITLPLYYDMTERECDAVISAVKRFFWNPCVDVPAEIELARENPDA
ncbi:DegT/DnrJ/EryC1/StrS family aminotransferase [Thalassoglobus sp.]|uniref:DegT/DnrJ/EryC1/StrS family aminotransferase n=1 Tax=Thalassoglobus sp. TaxID=2795869 RepID=UPI003AA87121